MLRCVIVLLSVMVFAGCGGATGDTTQTAQANQPATPKARISALETSGKIPQLDRTATLRGTDSDSNGVRDDVDAYIAATYPAQGQKTAAHQFANVLQAALEVNSSDLSAVKSVSINGTRAVNCIFRKFDGSAGSKQPALVVEELRAVSTNTKARLLAYLAYAKALDGTSGAMPEGDTCE